MGDYKPINKNTYNIAVSQLNVDQKEWNKFSVPVVVKQFTEVNYVDANKRLPYLAAVSTGLYVFIYNVRSGRPVGQITRFQRTAYGATYRDDGRLLVAGSDDHTVRLFDCKKYAQLRAFKGHNGPVHKVKFMPDFPPRLASFSDDKTVAIWDIGDEKQIMTLNGHTDYVRAGCINASSPHLVMSGSEDRTLKVWDVRTGSAVFTLDHGSSHVNDVVCLHGGNLLASAAGAEIRIWDLSAGKLVHKLCRHHKDVTSLGLTSDGTRLVSGSLDQQLKIHDVSNFNVVHSVLYPSSITTFAVMPEDSGVVVGMFAEGKGLLSIQRKVEPVIKETKQTEEVPKHVQESTVKVINKKEGSKYPVVDRLLLSFQYSKVLDYALSKDISLSESMACMDELIRRDGLRAAMSGRGQTWLNKLGIFVCKYFPDSTYQAVLYDVIMLFLDLYSKDAISGSQLEKTINRLHNMVRDALIHTQESIMLAGHMKMIQSMTEK